MLKIMKNPIVLLVFMIVLLSSLVSADHTIEKIITCNSIDIDDSGKETCDDADYNGIFDLGDTRIKVGLPKLPGLSSTKDTFFPGGNYLDTLSNQIIIGSDTKNFISDDKNEFQIDGILGDYNLEASWNNGNLRDFSHKFNFEIDMSKIDIKQSDVRQVEIGSKVYQKILIDNELLDGLDLVIEDKMTSNLFLTQDIKTYSYKLKKGQNGIVIEIPSENIGDTLIERNYIIKILDTDFLLEQTEEQYNVVTLLAETDEGVALDPKEDTIAYVVQKSKDYSELVWVLLFLGLIIVILLITIYNQRFRKK